MRDKKRPRGRGGFSRGFYLVREQGAARRHGQDVEHRGADDGADPQVTLRHEGADDIDEQFRARTRGRHYSRAGHVLGDIEVCRGTISFLFVRAIFHVGRISVTNARHNTPNCKRSYARRRNERERSRSEVILRSRERKGGRKKEGRVVVPSKSSSCTHSRKFS